MVRSLYALEKTVFVTKKFVPDQKSILGGWTYQFTKDGSIIWEQKPVAVPVPAPAPTEAKSSSTTTATHTAGEPVLFGETTATRATNDQASLPHQEPAATTTALTSLSHDLSTLTLYQHREASDHRKQDRQGHHKRSAVVHHQEASTSSASQAQQGGRRQRHGGGRRKGKAAAHDDSGSRRRKADSHQKDLGAIVSAEKGKKFDAKTIIDKWQWG